MIAWLIEILAGVALFLGLGWLTGWWLWPGPQLAATVALYMAFDWWVTR